jgi:hypothetical protein
MNKLNKKISLAKKKWEELENNKDPIIYVGAASCGRAAGALDVLKGIDVSGLATWNLLWI